ncbi:DUF6226 family protein [Glutamicibacter ardleyensis]|uniref:DUF6226 family protein n=1 Tax=Glutamicibacter ardleyensis TaxID=225894 RepID=UPI003F90B170
MQLEGYRRPVIAGQDYFDDQAALISYGQRWPGEPAEESYSVTIHPQRFAPLHTVAQALMDWLLARFNVRCLQDSGLAAELGYAMQPVVESVRLIPVDRACAPLGLVFTDFPGVLLSVGALYQWHFPICGCDACDDSVDELLDDLEEQITTVVNGHFTEILDESGAGLLTHRFDSDGVAGREISDGVEEISPERLARARAMLPADGAWAPWPLRGA